MSRSVSRLLLPLLILALCGCLRQTTPQPPVPSTHQEQLGDSYFQSGNFEQALAEYDKALAEGADPASVAWRKGFAHFARDEWDPALQRFREAVRLDPQLAIAWEGAGMAAFQLGLLDEAVNAFEQTRTLAPKHWIPYAFLAAIYHVRGRIDEAKLFHDEALTLGGPERQPLVVATLRQAHAQAVKLTPVVKGGADVPVPAPVAEETSGDAELTARQQRDMEAALQALAEKSQAQASPQPQPQPQPEFGVDAPPTVARPTAAVASSSTPPTPEVAAVQGEAPQDVPPLSTSASAPVPAPAPVETPAPAAEPAAPAAVAATPQPAAASAPTVASAAAPDEDLAVGATHYSIMESSFPKREQAESRVAELRDKGLAVYVGTINLGSKGIWYRVLFGPFRGVGAAREAQDRLKREHGFKELLILQQK